jgi:FKBP-type peptidyl-prolyl cis-trans isomerase SlyD
MVLKKKDFIEIEFIGRLNDGEIFDSNVKEHLKKINSSAEPKPFIFCLGEGMFLKGIEDFLIGKEIKEYKIELSPEKAFGKRESNLVKMIPLKIFIEQKINPIPGVTFNFDGKIAKILTVSGGRVMVDFNNPLAGKEVTYEIKILRKIEDINEKIKAFINFLFKKDLKFEIKEKNLIVEVEKSLSEFIKMFKDKFKELFELDLEVKEIIEEKKKSQ